MDITSDAARHGIREQSATIVGSDGLVPLALWTPEHEPPGGLVLVGHGGSGHKTEDYVVTLARRLVRSHSVAVAAIDGPLHGDRRATAADPTVVLMEFAQAWAADASLTDRMVADWTATLDALQDEPQLRDVPVGYWGVSMGTLLGLPFVAAEPRVRTCVLGLAGLSGPTSARLAADAANVLIPTLFMVQLDDELFSTESSLALFRSIASPEKRFYACPGKHRDVPSDAFLHSIAFLASHLEELELDAEVAG